MYLVIIFNESKCASLESGCMYMSVNKNPHICSSTGQLLKLSGITGLGLCIVKYFRKQ